MDHKRNDSVIEPEKSLPQQNWSFEEETEEKWKRLQLQSGVSEGEALRLLKRMGRKRTEEENKKMVNKARAELWDFNMSRLKKTKGVMPL